MLVSAQIAVTLVLALGATLFVATLRNLQRSDGGSHEARAAGPKSPRVGAYSARELARSYCTKGSTSTRRNPATRAKSR
jgi:hypothetical protein